MLIIPRFPCVSMIMSNVCISHALFQSSPCACALCSRRLALRHRGHVLHCTPLWCQSAARCGYVFFAILTLSFLYFCHDCDAKSRWLYLLTRRGSFQQRFDSCTAHARWCGPTPPFCVSCRFGADLLPFCCLLPWGFQQRGSRSSQCPSCSTAWCFSTEWLLFVTVSLVFNCVRVSCFAYSSVP